MEPNFNSENIFNLLKQLPSCSTIDPSSCEYLECEEGECEEEYVEHWPDSSQYVINQIYELLLPIIVDEWITGTSSSEGYEEEEIEIEDKIDKVIFKNGNIYEGYTSQLRFHGKGVFKWADGSFYDGFFYKNYAKGIGTYKNAEGDHYVGQFNQGVCSHGISDLTTNNYKYEGSFLNGMFHGRGVLVATAVEFDGEFRYDHPVTGIRQYRTGTFIGDFDKYGHRKYGKFIFYNSDSYYGHWYEDKYNDFGVYRWPYINITTDNPLITNKETYFSGFWSDGNRNGVGLLRFDDLLIISNWRLDIKEEHGLIRAANGTIYVSNKMFVKNLCKDSWRLTLNDTTKSIVRDIINFPNKFDGRIYCNLKDNVSPNYLLCNEIFKNNIMILMSHIEEKLPFTPYFLPDYQIDKSLNFLEFMATISDDIEYISLERELKCLRQIIEDNYHIIKLIYIRYARFDRTITEEESPKFNNACMNRLGLWLFYNDVLSNLPSINKFDNIELCDNLYHLIPKDSLNPNDPIYFWEFLRHIIHIIVILNKTNCSILEQALIERITVFGLFATMFLIFLREFSIINETQESLAWTFILKNPKLCHSLLNRIYNIKNINNFDLREVYKFFVNIKTVHDKRFKYDSINFLDNVTNDNFIECCTKIFPHMLKGGYLVDICFNITPLEFCIIIYLCFEKEIINRPPIKPRSSRQSRSSRFSRFSKIRKSKINI